MLLLCTCMLRIRDVLSPADPESGLHLDSGVSLTTVTANTYAYNIIRCIASILPRYTLADFGSLNHISSPLRAARMFLATSAPEEHEGAIKWCDELVNRIKVSGMGWPGEEIFRAFWKSDSGKGTKLGSLWEGLLGKNTLITAGRA